jgi:hypothetical protein
VSKDIEEIARRIREVQLPPDCEACLEAIGYHKGLHHHFIDADGHGTCAWDGLSHEAHHLPRETS